ncbi:MAG: DUF502 domain-containing protein [Pyrinomonadaceae bacterium]|nr:DUF502 domain-containing protein [Phycisphaerales bacterium]
MAILPRTDLLDEYHSHMAREKTTFAGDFKRFFVRGLAILLPSVLTLWILWQAYLFLDRQVAEPINRGIRAGILLVIPSTVPQAALPTWFVISPSEVERFRQTLAKAGSFEAQRLLKKSDAELTAEIRAQNFKTFWDNHWYFRFIGLVVAISLIYLAGRVLGGFLGRKLYRHIESFMTRIPVFKQVYPHVKQVVEMIFGEKQMAFKRVVLVEYPRKEIWTIGFVTSSGMKSIAEHTGGKTVTVFIPSTPTPFTGFTITVLESQAIDIPITIDEALRFVLTGGVLVPGKQSTGAIDGPMVNPVSPLASSSIDPAQTVVPGPLDPTR